MRANAVGGPVHCARTPRTTSVRFVLRRRCVVLFHGRGGGIAEIDGIKDLDEVSVALGHDVRGVEAAPTLRVGQFGGEVGGNEGGVQSMESDEGLGKRKAPSDEIRLVRQRKKLGITSGLLDFGLSRLLNREQSPRAPEDLSSLLRGGS